MIKLEIKKSDGSLYWIENFSEQDSADKWLAEEMTRPYWEDDYVSEFIIIPDIVIDLEAEKAKQDLIILKRSDAVAAVGTIDTLTSVRDLKEVVRKLAAVVLNI